MDKLAVFFRSKDDSSLTREEYHECLRIMKSYVNTPHNHQSMLRPLIVDKRPAIKSFQKDEVAIKRIFSEHKKPYAQPESSHIISSKNEVCAHASSENSIVYDFTLPACSKYAGLSLK